METACQPRDDVAAPPCEPYHLQHAGFQPPQNSQQDYHRKVGKMVTLDVENDPIFCPMVDRMASVALAEAIVSQSETFGVEITPDQIDTLKRADRRSLATLFVDMARSKDAQEYLNDFVSPDSGSIRR